MNATVPIRRALLSVSDKTGLVELARALAEKNVHLLASGGTYKTLVDAGLAVTEVSAHTGQPEILGGRVKTLHPKLHGGILARRDVPGDLEALKDQGIDLIDLVVVNLYPFEQTVAKPGVHFEEAVENIDIGGPSLIRGAAKNHAHVAVLTSPDQYAGFLESFRETGGTMLAMRKMLALDVFRLTARYDAAISAYLENQLAPEAETFPERLNLGFRRRSTLRYGENPHQQAAMYVEDSPRGAVLANAAILHGKELSYNNLLDLDSALRVLKSFREVAVVVLKHNNPCGAALGATAAEAFEWAYAGDSVSAFGGIVGLNRRVDRAAAVRMIVPGRFLECIIAPGFDDDALSLLKTKPTWKNSVRLLATNEPIGPDGYAAGERSGFDLRRIEGGLLAQGWDPIEQDDPTSWEVATKRAPTEAERVSLDFAWKVCAAVKSNAIVLVRGTQVVGVGAGQMSRLDSVKIAVEKAGDRAKGAVLASDAFFPFRDGPDAAAKAGVAAIIQPGGSKRDAETFTACDEHGLAMVLTGRRHFRH